MLAMDYLQKHDMNAAHKLVASHLKLVAKIAMSYKSYGLPQLDLIQEGNIGLMQAVKKYNPSLGFRLSTYAMWWIKASIKEYILKSWSLVKIGTTTAQKKLFFSLNKVKKQISNSQSRKLNFSDYKLIANKLDVDEKEVREMDIRMNSQDSSLNVKISDNTSGSNDSREEFIDLIASENISQEQIVISKEEKDIKQKMLFDAIKTLSLREQTIITKRMLSEKPVTLDILSKEFSISKERVRQIENKAFIKIKDHMLNSTDFTRINSQQTL
ncbi:MAG TPA: RNA polymerase factor sigma-32 [Candidatus Megaira endosymbiont of Hartmannula sinica]|nr:RNA polymerase factor sigma-32 [Candidatus Megaera endosymbiont of Hartmannula sinica]